MTSSSSLSPLSRLSTLCFQKFEKPKIVHHMMKSRPSSSLEDNARAPFLNLSTRGRLSILELSSLSRLSTLMLSKVQKKPKNLMKSHPSSLEDNARAPFLNLSARGRLKDRLVALDDGAARVRF